MKRIKTNMKIGCGKRFVFCDWVYECGIKEDDEELRYCIDCEKHNKMVVKEKYC